MGFIKRTWPFPAAYINSNQFREFYESTSKMDRKPARAWTGTRGCWEQACHRRTRRTSSTAL